MYVFNAASMKKMFLILEEIYKNIPGTILGHIPYMLALATVIAIHASFAGI